MKSRRQLQILGMSLIVIVLQAAACTPAPAPTAAATPAPTASTAQKATIAATTAPLVATAQNLLTVAEVERVTGLSGVKTVPYNPSMGAGGDLNFVDEDMQLILMLKLSGPSAFGTIKADARYSTGPISDIGDDAFGMPSPLDAKASFGVAFLKGAQAATLSTYIGQGGLAVSFDEIQELSKIVASRM